MLFDSRLVMATSLAMAAVLAHASPVNHAHMVHKREAAPQAIVTVYVTVSVPAPTSAPEDTAVAVPTISAPASAAPSQDTSSHVESHAAVNPKSSFSYSSSYSSSASSAHPPKSSAPSNPSGGSVGSGGAKGITYSPYLPGSCKSAGQVKSEIARLSGFDIIRIYGVDCDQVSNVLAALRPGQKIMLGIFDMAAIESGLATINSAVAPYGWSVVHSIVIGNELVNNGAASVSQIAAYLSRARSALSGYGYSGPVVSVDTFIAVINNPGLCSLSDYIAVNAHAFFDSTTSAAQAGSWVQDQISRVSAACASVGVQKQVLITETGWPSQGDSNGAAVPSKSNQQAAVAAIKAAAGSSCVLFNAFNDLWKDDGPFNAEKYWGIYDN